MLFNVSMPGTTQRPVTQWFSSQEVLEAYVKEYDLKAERTFHYLGLTPHAGNCFLEHLMLCEGYSTKEFNQIIKWLAQVNGQARRWAIELGQMCDRYFILHRDWSSIQDQQSTLYDALTLGKLMGLPVCLSNRAMFNFYLDVSLRVECIGDVINLSTDAGEADFTSWAYFFPNGEVYGLNGTEPVQFDLSSYKLYR